MTQDRLYHLAIVGLCREIDREEEILKENPNDGLAKIRLERYTKEWNEINAMREVK